MATNISHTFIIFTYMAMNGRTSKRPLRLLWWVFPKMLCNYRRFWHFHRKPSDLTARAQTYSSYKSHNTGKILAGINPLETISYISKPCVGHVWDVYHTENCDVLKSLRRCDLVLADPGFTVQEQWSYIALN